MPEEQRRREILEAAGKQFQLLGLRKTSMEDIASNAGISRALLYTYFKNKEEIFLSVASAIHEGAVRHAQEHLSKPHKSDLVHRLASALLARHRPFFRTVTESNSGSELFDEHSRLCGDLVVAARQRFESMLAANLREANREGEIRLKRHSVSANQVAELLNLSAHGLKRGAADVEVYELRIRNLTKLVIAGLA